ncbi:phosphotransferase [Sorangium cellulosum]|uniref:Phosphotransferase n=1 Tax=Sorangium cellulosum TaxID=56 RepID=A0A4P2Q8H5_SORCE|nr:AAA family ATPase [Sorangium cellulosum]AUX25551.1 phosphotransferase [Sorangium cellulosum]
MNERESRSDSPSILLITGLMAAGKSTVAQRLAERLPRSVHLRGDVFRRMIVGGQAEMGFELSEEAERQLRLRYRIAAAAADLYFQAGFTVVHQDIVLGPGLAEVVRYYADRPLHVVVLCPRPAVVAAREAGRAKRGYQDTSAVLDFDRVLRAETPRLGLWLDTSELTVAETVDEILGRLGEARVSGAAGA